MPNQPPKDVDRDKLTLDDLDTTDKQLVMDAVRRGVFGSPSFFVGDELFFGKDRLRDVELEIDAQKGKP